MTWLQPSRYVSGTIQLIGLISIIWGIAAQVHWGWWVAAYVTHFFYYQIGAGVGNHRYFSHNAFKVNKFWHYFITFCSVVGTTTAPNVYRAVHLAHHKHSDHEGDPHWFGKYGYRMVVSYLLDNYKTDTRGYVKHSNPETHFIFKHYYLFHIAWLTVLYLIHPLAPVFLYFVPMFGSIAGNACAMTICHHIGYRNYETDEYSRNAWYLWPLMFGEVWHNNHHGRPGDPNMRVKWWELDPGYWFIRLVRQKPKRTL